MTSYRDLRMYVGIVVSNVDITNTGLLSVQIEELSDNITEVTLTSPFFHPNGGGIVAIPEVGAKILLWNDLHSNKFYYMSTIIEPPTNSQTGGLSEWNLFGDKKIYNEAGKPQKVTFTNQFNSGLKISRKFRKTSINSKVDLDSEAGKRLSLNDSPQIDAVILRNEHGDGVAISSNSSDTYSERSIEVKSKGAQRFITYQSGMDLFVIDGRDLSLQNFSTGAYSNTSGKRYGNININSKEKDINISSDGDSGRIFLITPNARIQIESDGSIIIKSDKDVQIESGGDLDIKCDKDMRIQAKSINIKTDESITMDAGTTLSSKAGTINAIDGTQVHLNSKLAIPALPAQVKTPDKTDYDK